MKKVLLLVGAGLFPYAVLFARRLSVVFIVGLVCAVTLFILSRRERWPAQNLALCSMLLKLAQIPAYILFFLMGMSGVFFVQFLAATLIIAWFIDALTILLSGIVGLAAVTRCRNERLLTRAEYVIHGILQFIFCLDVLSAIIVVITVYARRSKEVSA